MKTTLAWLKEHLETEAPLDEIVERLVMLGHEVEGVENRAAGLEPFTVASVVSAEPHPNADRLKVCVVDTGKGQVQVVCGAPNAHAGMKGVFAPAGTVIPRTGALLKETVIRGVASRGMLCSAYELGLGEDHEGIIELPQDAPVGAPYASVIGLGDTVLDIKVTPNRADCLGVRGIARDLAAAGLGQAEAARHDAGPRAFPFADRHRDRGPHRLPAVSRPAHPRRPQRAEPGMAARPARSDRAAADLGAGRHHEFPDLRPRPAAACVRCRRGSPAI